MCRDSTRPCCRRAGGMPLLQSRSMTARAVTSPPHHRTHRRGATALCHNPVRGAQRSVPGLDTPLLSACRRYATTPEPESDRASGLAFSYPPTASGVHAPTQMRRGRTAADAPRAAERTKKIPQPRLEDSKV